MGWTEIEQTPLNVPGFIVSTLKPLKSFTKLKEIMNTKPISKNWEHKKGGRWTKLYVKLVT